MFKSMRRIVNWAGKYKWRLYLGVVFSFFSSFTTAVFAYWAQTALPTKLIWQSTFIIIGSIFLNFLLSYAKAVLQESIGYEVAS